MSRYDLHIDFETRSTLDLKKVGLYRYATHPTTDVWCAVWIWDSGDAPVQRAWTPGGDPPLAPEDLDQATIYAHNAGFEYAIWSEILGPRYRWPVPRLDRFICTAAMAAAMSLPRDLGGAAIAVGLDEKKDQTGRRLMLQMAKPRAPRAGEDRGKTYWWDDADRRQRLLEYCQQDVWTDYALHRKLRALSDKERCVWLLDQKINARGVAVDLDGVRRAQITVEKELDRLNTEMAQVTEGAVTSVNQVSVLTAWLRQRGVPVDTLGKQAVADTLANDALWADPQDEAFQALLDLGLVERDSRPRRALEIRLEAAKSSTAKLKAFQERAEKLEDHWRCRENFMYHGAGTGRWSGKGLQLQNFPRGALQMAPEDIAEAIAYLDDPEALRLFHGPPLTVVSDCLRSLLIAKPGHRLLVADYANIEGRALPWLAGDDRKLDAFRAADAKTGPGIYERTAAGIYGVPVESVTKAQRQIGKTAELACGYQGGVGAFQSMAKNFGLKVPDTHADAIKEAWRQQHPEIVQYWYDLERAAKEAIRRPGSKPRAGAAGREVAFVVSGGILWLRLPSGRLLAYPSPRLEQVEAPWGGTREAVTFLGVDTFTRKWSRQSTYGGSLAENITQAACRDLLAEAMLRLDAAGYPIVLHAHDEVVAEVPDGFGSLDEFERIMCDSEPWAAGLPVVADGYEAVRYRK